MFRRRLFIASLAALVVGGPATSSLAGEVSVGEVRKGGGTLAAQLSREIAVAKQKSLRPFVEVSATIRVDTDDFEVDALTKAGIATPAVPTFFELDATGKTTGRKISGGAWGDDVPAQMAPPLRAFFHAR